MQLSIIIVNFRVRYFLEQCLHSVDQAIKHLEGEVIVIDNNSGDGSIAYLKPSFPWVRFIELSENIGFAKANNLGLKQAKGEFVLFLNPDTIVAEDAFTKSIGCFQQHQDVGALGIKMLDGSGRFLKESKRGFPSPLTSFYKLTGLANLFPHSSIFARYYLGHLSNEQDSEVEVLAGAFMMLRKSLLDEIGGFDEIFFMYGEDIDLSYRVSQAGMKNYYLASSSIIHFKGESTRKGSLNYVKIFYQAMILFVHKHYQGAGAFLFRSFLKIAIWLRAFFAVGAGFFRMAGLPLADIFITVSTLLLTMQFWYSVIKPNVMIDGFMVRAACIVFSSMFLLVGSIAGLYDKCYNARRVFYSLLIWMTVILAFYSLLPEQYRFSRGIITVAGLLSIFAILFFRLILQRYNLIETEASAIEFRQLIVSGEQQDYEEVALLLQRSGSQQQLLGRLTLDNSETHVFGSVFGLKNIIKSISLHNLVFCISEKYSTKMVLKIIENHAGLIRFIFHFRNSNSLIASDNVHSRGEVVAATMYYNLAKMQYRRSKRVFDILLSLCVLLSLPLQLLLQEKRWESIRNACLVLVGKKTWVGYFTPTCALPQLRDGILCTNGRKHVSINIIDEKLGSILDGRYAIDYTWAKDLSIVLNNFRHLGG